MTKMMNCQLMLHLKLLEVVQFTSTLDGCGGSLINRFISTNTIGILKMKSVIDAI